MPGQNDPVHPPVGDRQMDVRKHIDNEEADVGRCGDGNHHAWVDLTPVA